MILWGRIEEFSLAAVLQFLSLQRQTGALEVQDFEEQGVLYLDRGQIAAVSNPAWDERLTARLVNAGALTQIEAKQCWMQAGESGVERPVAGYLLAAARSDRQQLVQIVNEHVADVVLQLMYWNAGTFSLRNLEEHLQFAVVPTLDVETFLLEAYRRADEGERPWREKVSSAPELCLTCTIECSEEIKQRYLRQDICLWRSMPAVLKESIYREQDTVMWSPSDDGPEDLPFL